MSLFECPCPNNAVLDDIPKVDCELHLGQIQRLLFVKQGEVIWDSATGGGAGTGVPNTGQQLDTLADWQALMTATDDTKVVATPTIKGDPIITAGESITTGGGDNSTLNGVEEVTGENPSVFTANFKGLTGRQVKALRALPCHELEVYFVLQGNRLAYKADPTATANSGYNSTGFPIQSLFVGSRTNNGYATKDVNAISFNLLAGWDEDLEIVKLGFNGLTDL